jgi:hypothetical protein
MREESRSAQEGVIPVKYSNILMALLMFCRFPNSLIGQFTQVFVSDIID